MLAAEEPTAAATAGFNAYMSRVEARLAKQHQSADTFLAPVDAARLRNGELIIEKLTPAAGVDLPGAMLHDWRGTAFVPGAKGEDIEQVMRGFEAYHRHYSPQVLRARVLAQQGDHYQVTMRVRQVHILTVVMDIRYDVTFGRGNFGETGARQGYSISRSTQISEIAQAETARERALSASEEHGFMWRLNTYWSYEERDGGLYHPDRVGFVDAVDSDRPGMGDWAVCG